MEEFVLQPAYVRGSRLIADRKADPVKMDWSGLVEAVGGGKTPSALLTLRRLREGAFVGERVRDGRRTNFLVSTPAGTNSIAWITKKDPLFEIEVDKVYQVQGAFYDVSLKEAS